MRWFALFVLVPLLELYLLLWIGGLVGFWPTVGITLVTGLLGGALARREGRRVWREWRTALAEMRPPESGIVEGVLVLLGGALMVTPGVLTDVTGILLLVPFTRRPVARRVRDRLEARFNVQTVSGGMSGHYAASVASQYVETTAEEVAAPQVEAASSSNPDR